MGPVWPIDIAMRGRGWSLLEAGMSSDAGFRCVLGG